MRILVFSDIHANLNALEAVLNAAGEIDAAWCLGDLVGYGPDPNECIERIQSLPNLVCTLGNHDAAAIGKLDTISFNEEARRSVHWMKKTLSQENIKFLKSLPEKSVFGHATLVHGSPHNPVWEYLLDPYVAYENLSFFETQICLYGHTHLPMVFIFSADMQSMDWHLLVNGETITLESRCFLNPGSVGQPRDHDPRSAFAIFTPEKNSWELHRTTYDVKNVQQRIFDSGLPQRFGQRLEEGW